MGATRAISPLAPDGFPELGAVPGVATRTLAAGLRYHGRPDLFLATVDAGTTVAGVFTNSACPSAPVDWCRQILGSPDGAQGARAVLCNAGNANAFTGAAGAASVKAQVETVGAWLGVAPTQVYVCSTGVIGECLDDTAMVAALDSLVTAEPGDWATAADAIRTTDTFAKGAGASGVTSAGASIVGIAKGSGMIAPNMATMLGFVFTDAAVTGGALQTALVAATAVGFNRTTVDSDTSTSDTVLLFATGKTVGEAGPIDGPDHPDWVGFCSGLDAVCIDLAHQIVRDGEGATKFIEVKVTGASTDESAEVVARAIADSPLVKTAMAAQDANWGRIVMAVGKAGEPADRDRLAIWIGDELVASNGVVDPGYSEDRANEHLAQPDIVLRADLGMGVGQASVWTCDLTHGYIEINAGYRS